MTDLNNPERSVSSNTKVLIVDDDKTNRLILKAILIKEGFEVVLAEDGVEAIDAYEKNLPDIILMDVMMPNKDGLQATKEIKLLSGAEFVPVIFLTAITDEAQLAKCIECGGDDFLTKPYSVTMLRAKLMSMLRLRELYNRVSEQNKELSYHQERIDHEHRVAEKVFASILRSGSLVNSPIRYLLSPQAIFNGDLLLVARRPSGSYHILLGDFSGHGLSAAIGAMPVSDTFYDMTKNGYSINEIIPVLNRKLLGVLSVQQFLAVCVIELSSEFEHATVWNAGLPDALLVGGDGKIRARIESHSIPLGIVDSSQMDITVQFVPIESNDHLFLYTDGLIEARNTHGEQFTQERLENSFDGQCAIDEVFDEILLRVADFRGGQEQEDDITFVDLPCASLMASMLDSEVTSSDHPLIPSMDWSLSLCLESSALKMIDPLPVMIQAVMGVQAMAAHRENIYVMLAELFTNAIDHGLLGLDSKTKETPAGFVEYFDERNRRLASMKEGSIKLMVENRRMDKFSELTVRIEDSGSGFDQSNIKTELDSSLALHGRGIPLVKTITRELSFENGGAVAIAKYAWGENLQVEESK